MLPLLTLCTPHHTRRFLLIAKVAF
jgi:hypothetical protein